MVEAEHYKERSAAPRLGELLDNHPLMLERIITPAGLDNKNLPLNR